MSLSEKYHLEINIDLGREMWKCNQSAPERNDLIPATKKETPVAAKNLAICYYALGNKPETKRYAREAVKGALEYFFGSWRQSVPTDQGVRDPEWWRRNLPWMEQFEFGVCWAAVLGDWDSVRRIAQYPGEDCMLDIGRTQEEKLKCLLMAEYLKEEPAPRPPPLLRKVLEAKAQRVRLVAEVIAALSTRDAPRFRNTMDGYLQFFRKKLFRKDPVDSWISCDGTLLVKAAAKEGIGFTPLEEDWNDFLISLP